MSIKAKILTVTVGGLLAAVAVAGASPSRMVVGPGGAVLQLSIGAYGDLFPEGTQAYPGNLVLALDVSRGDSTERFLVPQTRSRFPETSPTLFFDDQGGVAYLLWEGFHNDIHPLLYLTSFDGERFGEVFEISGSPFSRKGLPHLEVTRDRGYSADLSPVDRLMIHVTWIEEVGNEVHKRYAPLVLMDGEFLGWNPVQTLSASPVSDDAKGWGDLLRVQPGPQSNSFLAGFFDADQASLASTMVEVVPQALSRLADHVATTILAQRQGMDQGELAEVVRQGIYDLDLGFHPASLDYIVAQVEELILASAEDEDLDFLAGTLRGTIVHIGMRVGTGGLATGEASQVMTLRPEVGEGLSHHIKLSPIGVWPLPEVGGPARVFFADDGREALVAWDSDTEVLFRETLKGGWGEVQAVALGERLDRSTVYDILESRARNR